jgi:GT2 family glycosyltransferase
MIKFVSARYEGDVYDAFLGPSVEGKYQIANVFEGSSICEKYNKGIDQLDIQDNDIVVFAHADVKIIDKDFEDKVLYIFDQLPKLGVAGVIGAVEMHETGGWWLSDHRLHRGHVMQWVDDDEKNKYHMIRTKGNFNNLCVLDGLCIMVRGSLVKQLRFDEDTYQNTYNFYDYDYCLEARQLGYTVGVFDILLEHRSAGEGIHKPDWNETRIKFINKWINKGYSFPIR